MSLARAAAAPVKLAARDEDEVVDEAPWEEVPVGGGVEVDAVTTEVMVDGPAADEEVTALDEPEWGTEEEPEAEEEVLVTVVMVVVVLGGAGLPPTSFNAWKAVQLAMEGPVGMSVV